MFQDKVSAIMFLTEEKLLRTEIVSENFVITFCERERKREKERKNEKLRERERKRGNSFPYPSRITF